MTVCSIDLRVGGTTHGLRTEDGNRVLVSWNPTWRSSADPDRRDVAVRGLPDAQASRRLELHEADGVTTLTINLAFRDQAWP